LLAAGCGQDKFEQEVATEESAVKLARETVKGDYELITTEELKELVDSEQDFVLIDAMPYGESYEDEHIPGAKNFAFTKDHEMKEWKDSDADGKTQADYVKILGDDKEKLIVVYCGFTKCLRSHNAAIWAKKLGYENVKRHPGGIYAWKGKGYDTEAD
jgi:rhodanese-related sulfurtransferase